MRLLQAFIVVAAFTVPLQVFAHVLPSGHGHTTAPIIVYLAALHTLKMPLPLVLISTGLLFGLNRDVDIVHNWLSLVLGIVAGVIGFIVLGLYIRPALPLLLLTVIVSIWAASGVRMHRSPAIVLAAVIGYFVGLFFTPIPVPWLMPDYAVIGGILGATLGVLGTYLTVALITDRWGFAWIKIAFRALAAWIAAIAMMVAALSLR